MLAGVAGSAADKQGPQGRGWGRARAMLARWAAVWSAGPGERDGPRERECSGWVWSLDKWAAGESWTGLRWVWVRVSFLFSFLFSISTSNKV